jgi:hypothetical protein
LPATLDLVLDVHDDRAVEHAFCKRRSCRPASMLANSRTLIGNIHTLTESPHGQVAAYMRWLRVDEHVDKASTTARDAAG